MHADLKGALKQINKTWRYFTHKGKSMSKEQVEIVLKYGIKKGYESTSEFKTGEVENLISN